MVSISHWGMFRVEEYPAGADLLHCGVKYAYLELLDKQEALGPEFARVLYDNLSELYVRS